MRTWHRWAIAGAAAAAVTLAASEAPLALRRFEAFRVERVHVTGTEHLPSADAIAASGITSSSSVFDDFEPWREALERQPLVLRAHVSRRLPNTIVLAITESEPIVLVQAGGDAGAEGGAGPSTARLASTPLPASARGGEAFRAVDARGRVLPIGAAQLERELPMVNADVTVAEAGPRIDATGVRVVRAFARILEAEPWLAAWTAEIDALPDGVQLTVRWPAGAKVLLSHTDADVLEAVRLTVLDLASTAKTERGAADSVAATVVVPATYDGAETPGPALAATQLERLDRVDARFRDQVVVTLRETGRGSREERAR